MHTIQLMPLPLTVSCFSKIQIGFTFLVPAHPGSPGKRTIKRVCVCIKSEANKNRQSLYDNGYTCTSHSKLFNILYSLLKWMTVSMLMQKNIIIMPHLLYDQFGQMYITAAFHNENQSAFDKVIDMCIMTSCFFTTLYIRLDDHSSGTVLHHFVTSLTAVKLPGISRFSIQTIIRIRLTTEIHVSHVVRQVLCNPFLRFIILRVILTVLQQSNSELCLIKQLNDVFALLSSKI